MRISFVGGGTDVEPFLSDRGGMVLSTTINRYCHATLSPRADSEIELQSEDFGIISQFFSSQKLRLDGELDLVKAVVKRLYGGSQGFSLYTQCEAPPGSGLGSSSTMIVTLIGLFKSWLNLSFDRYALANLAYDIERVDLGIKGGKQDQFAATFGGFNYIEFYHDGTVVEPLRLSTDVLNELHYHLVLCYTGKTRLSAQIINDQINSYLQQQEKCLKALEAMKDLTIAMKKALLLGRCEEFGSLLHEVWLNKRQLADGVSSEEIDTLYHLARSKGALGGKILGAGGGGHLLLYCPYKRKNKIIEALREAGTEIVPFSFEQQGLITWKVS
ncbi:MAG TPA: GHMP kinase [Bacillota bacterium]|mgnify:FL=1|nr:GHMP kinase [Bacillota bacterium]HPT67297.1 GHMP kinase [Bacillota bacterium]